MANFNSGKIPTDFPMTNIYNNVMVYFKKNESNECNDNELGTGTLYVTIDMTVWIKKNGEGNGSPFYLSDINEESKKDDTIFAKRVLDKLDEEKKERKKQYNELKNEFKRVEEKNAELEREVEKFKAEIEVRCCGSSINRNELEKKVEEKDENMESVLNTLRKDIESIEDKMKKVSEITGEIAVKENKIDEIVRWKEDIDKEEKKNNLIIFGWDSRGIVNKEQVSKFFTEELGTSVTPEDIDEVKSIGRSENKMTWVKMKTLKNKKKIFENRWKLKGKKMFIENDRTKKEIEDQKELARKAYIARREGRKVKVGFQKMWIDDELWLWDGKEKLLRRTRKGDQ
ncbi:Protein of unknown function [Cotesia congregata]|uniref:Uncharacterized protein n=1 Tax=Cotesia congregata TaxID=51543 RepID=A0A8J2MSV0_COTCN|nr:Protein of unknown function [Cotesia congregata]